MDGRTDVLCIIFDYVALAKLTINIKVNLLIQMVVQCWCTDTNTLFVVLCMKPRACI